MNDNGDKTENTDELSHNERLLELEKRKFELDRQRYEAEQRFFRKHFATIITSIISFAALIVSAASVYSTLSAQKTEQNQKDKDYNLRMIEFIAKNQDSIFSEDKAKSGRMKIIMIALSPEVANQYFSRFEAVSPSNEKQGWREAQEAAKKASLLVSYYASLSDKNLYTNIRKKLSEEGFNIVESNFYDKAPSWLEKESSVIYYDDANSDVVAQLVTLLKDQTNGTTFKVVKGSPFKEIQGQEKRRIFIHQVLR